MAITLEVTEKVKKEVKYLKAECGVRYWEDAEVNGQDDEDGTLIPLRCGDTWAPLIDLESGVVVGWPADTTASVHYKVCDAGVYQLLDPDKNVVKEIEGYVPSMMSPKDNGYGDYVIMDIDGDGKIAGWRVDLEEFEGGGDDV